MLDSRQNMLIIINCIFFILIKGVCEYMLLKKIDPDILFAYQENSNELILAQEEDVYFHWEYLLQ